MFLPDMGMLWSATAWQYRESLFYQLFTYFEETYFSVSFRVYEHIPLGPESNRAAQMLIVGLALGLIIATVMMTYKRRMLGRFLKDLIRAQALTPERAKTLMELNHFRNAALRRELARGINLKRYVHCREIENGEVFEPAQKPLPAVLRVLNRIKEAIVGKGDRPKIDFVKAHFYIPEDCKDQAEIRFETNKYDVFVAAGSIVLIVVFASLLCRFLPDIVQLMDNIIKMMAP